jgi:hypothetical protein
LRRQSFDCVAIIVEEVLLQYSCFVPHKGGRVGAYDPLFRTDRSILRLLALSSGDTRLINSLAKNVSGLIFRTNAPQTMRIGPYALDR